MDPIYLTTEDVVAINADWSDGGVRDWDVVDGAVNGCRATGYGEDLYPSLLDKAAALLRLLTTSQGFKNANKRTAWQAAETFLALNGYFITTTTVEAEILTLSIAENVIGQDRIVEWLTEHKLVT